MLATVEVGQGPRKIAVQPGPARAAAPAEAVVSVQTEDYAFKPDSVRGLPGQRLRLRLTSRSSTLHNITIPAQGVDRDIEPGAVVDVDVTLPEAGAVGFFCKFHAALGQRGEVVVARADAGR